MRQIANRTDTPLFAIDYRLSPKNKFPELLYDCIAALFWIHQFVQRVIGTKIEKYIFIGDSAGGNLIVAVTQWLIESKIDGLPQLIATCYPVLSGRLVSSDFAQTI